MWRILFVLFAAAAAVTAAFHLAGGAGTTDAQVSHTVSGSFSITLNEKPPTPRPENPGVPTPTPDPATTAFWAAARAAVPAGICAQLSAHQDDLLTMFRNGEGPPFPSGPTFTPRTSYDGWQTAHPAHQWATNETLGYAYFEAAVNVYVRQDCPPGASYVVNQGVLAIRACARYAMTFPPGLLNVVPSEGLVNAESKFWVSGDIATYRGERATLSAADRGTARDPAATGVDPAAVWIDETETYGPDNDPCDEAIMGAVWPTSSTWRGWRGSKARPYLLKESNGGLLSVLGRNRATLINDGTIPMRGTATAITSPATIVQRIVDNPDPCTDDNFCETGTGGQAPMTMAAIIEPRRWDWNFDGGADELSLEVGDGAGEAFNSVGSLAAIDLRLRNYGGQAVHTYPYHGLFDPEAELLLNVDVGTVRFTVEEHWEFTETWRPVAVNKRVGNPLREYARSGDMLEQTTCPPHSVTTCVAPDVDTGVADGTVTKKPEYEPSQVAPWTLTWIGTTLADNRPGRAADCNPKTVTDSSTPLDGRCRYQESWAELGVYDSGMDCAATGSAPYSFGDERCRSYIDRYCTYAQGGGEVTRRRYLNAPDGRWGWYCPDGKEPAGSQWQYVHERLTGWTASAWTSSQRVTFQRPGSSYDCPTARRLGTFGDPSINPAYANNLIMNGHEHGYSLDVVQAVDPTQPWLHKPTRDVSSDCEWQGRMGRKPTGRHYYNWDFTPYWSCAVAERTNRNSVSFSWGDGDLHGTEHDHDIRGAVALRQYLLDPVGWGVVSGNSRLSSGGVWAKYEAANFQCANKLEYRHREMRGFNPAGGIDSGLSPLPFSLDGHLGALGDGYAVRRANPRLTEPTPVITPTATATATTTP